MLEKYDKTYELPFKKKIIDITLSVRTIDKLEEINKKTRKPISKIIWEKFN